MPPRKSWREKLADSKGLPKIGRVMGRMTKRWGTGTMVVPAPREVDALMKQVPRGKVTTINELRAALARQHRVDIGCPITTGIFAWIAAHAAEEAAAEGVAALKRKLAAEGHKVVKKGRRHLVVNLEGVLFKP